MKLNVVELEMLIDACREMADSPGIVKQSETDYLRLMARLDHKLRRKLNDVTD